MGSAKVKSTRRWQLVGFPGLAGRESAGIVDLIAIRKDHARTHDQFKRGDLFEIILIQIKGGGARWPNADDIRRLRAVAKRYSAKDVILAEWVKGSHQNFYRGAPPPRGRQITLRGWLKSRHWFAMPISMKVYPGHPGWDGRRAGGL